jgi:hypothetical protein
MLYLRREEVHGQVGAVVFLQSHMAENRVESVFMPLERYVVGNDARLLVFRADTYKRGRFWSEVVGT